MSVLIEAVCLVIKAESIKAKYQGGWEQFKADYEETGFCSDDELVSVSFSSILEAVSQIDVLELKGLSHQEEGRGEDIVIVDQLRGFLDPNPWAEFGHYYLDKERSQCVKLCRLKGTKPLNIKVPAGWEYEGSLSEQYFGYGIFGRQETDGLKAACEAVARAFNRLDTSHLLPVLAEDLTYTSQWVFDSIKGKNRYLEYIEQKFRITRGEKAKDYAELARYRGEYCLVIAQDSKDNPIVTLMIHMKDGLISEMCMCCIPHFTECERLGVYP